MGGFRQIYLSLVISSSGVVSNREESAHPSKPVTRGLTSNSKQKGVHIRGLRLCAPPFWHSSLRFPPRLYFCDSLPLPHSCTSAHLFPWPTICPRGHHFRPSCTPSRFRANAIHTPSPFVFFGANRGMLAGLTRRQLQNGRMRISCRKRRRITRFYQGPKRSWHPIRASDLVYIQQETKPCHSLLLV